MENELTTEQFQQKLQELFGEAQSSGIIDVSQIEQASPALTLPEEQEVDFGDDIASQVEQLSSQFFDTPEQQAETQALEQDVQQADAQRRNLFQRVVGGLRSLAQLPEEQLEMEEDAGIPELQTQLTDITNEISQTQLRFRRQREALENQPGLTLAQRNARLADVSRKQNAELADLAVIQQAQANNLNTAQSIVDRKIDLMTQQQQAQLQTLQFFYQENKEQLTKKEDRLFQKKLQRDKFELDQMTDRLKTLENEKLNLVRNANANGAPNSVMKSIMGAENVEQAYKAAGRYGMSLEERLQKLEIAELMATSNTGNLSEKDSKALLKDQTAREAAARIGVISAVKDYQRKIEKFKGGNRMTRREKKELETALNTTVGSAINVAQGQGAMGDAEAARILGNLKPKRLRSFKTIKSAADGVIDAQDSLLQTNFDFIDSAYPGATDEFEVFAKYKLQQAPIEERQQAVILESINTFKNEGYTDTQIIEYYLPEQSAEAQQLYEMGYELDQIINALR